jgi:methylmalonyl-CoA mutase N-terminal domain/subunit
MQIYEEKCSNDKKNDNRDKLELNADQSRIDSNKNEITGIKSVSYEDYLSYRDRAIRAEAIAEERLRQLERDNKNIIDAIGAISRAIQHDKHNTGSIQSAAQSLPEVQPTAKAPRRELGHKAP